MNTTGITQRVIIIIFYALVLNSQGLKTMEEARYYNLLQCASW